MIVPSSIDTVLSNTIGRNKTGLQGVDDGVMAPETRSNVSDRAQARNDDHVLAELYRREFGGLLRLAISMTSSESASEEIVQDAFVKLQSAGNGVTNPAAYVRTTVVNACRSHHRHLAVVRRAPTPRSVAYEAAHDELFDAVAALPWRQQAVLALRFHLDLPEHEIASTLGCRPSTVRSLTFRALASLRKELDR